MSRRRSRLAVLAVAGGLLVAAGLLLAALASSYPLPYVYRVLVYQDADFSDIAADELLRAAFESPPSPSFSPDFEKSLRERLGRRRTSPALGLAARILLAVYGSAAAGLSVWILARIDWTASPFPAMAGTLLALVAVVSPLLLLPRWSPFAPPGLG